MIDKGAPALTDHQLVSAACEAMKKLLKDSSVVLTPNPSHTSLTGVIRFNDLGAVYKAGARLVPEC